MLKKKQVVMLPTNQKAQKGQIVLTLGGKSLYITSEKDALIINDNHFKGSTGKPQHIHFLSDEEIKKGDWFMRDGKLYNEFKTSTTPNTTIFIRLYPSLDLSEQWREVYISDCKKIIATTDQSLLLDFNKEGDGGCDYLPQPSDSFIQNYVEAYNVGKPITEVMVEYHPELYDGTETTASLSGRLKVNPKNNTITIKPVKDNWTREEVIAFAKKYAERCQAPIKPGDRWIEENL